MNACVKCGVATQCYNIQPEKEMKYYYILQHERHQAQKTVPCMVCI